MYRVVRVGHNTPANARTPEIAAVVSVHTTTLATREALSLAGRADYRVVDADGVVLATPRKYAINEAHCVYAERHPGEARVFGMGGGQYRGAA